MYVIRNISDTHEKRMKQKVNYSAYPPGGGGYSPIRG